MTWFFALPGKIKLYAVLIASAIGAFFMAYLMGRKDEAAAEHERELNEYVETRKRIDGVHIPDAQRWLQDRADKRDL